MPAHPYLGVTSATHKFAAVVGSVEADFFGVYLVSISIGQEREISLGKGRANRLALTLVGKVLRLYPQQFQMDARSGLCESLPHT